MIQEPLQQEILSRIDKLAEKLGVTVEYLWPHLVRLTILEVIFGFVLVIILILTAGVLWHQHKKADGYDAKEGWFVAAVVASLLAGLGVVLVVTLGVPVLLEPEAATLKGLLP